MELSHGTGKVLEDKNAMARRIARFFKPGDIVNLGIGAPLLVANYVNENVLIHTENGAIGVGRLFSRNDPDIPERTQLESFTNAGTMPFVPINGAMFFSQDVSFGLIRSGNLKATVLGAFEVSQTGDLANWYLPGKFAGMGGAMDLCGAKMVVVQTTHCAKNGKPKLVRECTLPLTCNGRVTHVVTERAVFEFRNRKMFLTEIREGYDLDNIKNNTEADFEIDKDLKTEVVF